MRILLCGHYSIFCERKALIYQKELYICEEEFESRPSHPSATPWISPWISILTQPFTGAIITLYFATIIFIALTRTALYNAPFFPYTRFNNSIVMGSLIFSLIAFYPVYLGGIFIVVKYRETFMERFDQWKVVKVMKASSFYKLYARYSELRG